MIIDGNQRSSWRVVFFILAVTSIDSCVDCLNHGGHRRRLAFLRLRATGRSTRSRRGGQRTFLAHNAPARTTMGPPSPAETPESVGLRGLYPPLQPHANGTLAVDDIHTLYFEEYGLCRQRHKDDSIAPPATNRRTLHALFLHGGPGAGCFPNHARFFDPNLYHVTLLDQRGAGRSTPRGETRQNSLMHLVQDIEVLRNHLEISSWDVILGGSWGVTLALAYAQSYPTHVNSLILRGVCLMRPQEVDWMFSNAGMARQIPEQWLNFSTAVASSDEGPRETLHAYYDRLLSPDPLTCLSAAMPWMRYEMGIFSSSTTPMDNSSSGSNSSSLIEKARAPVAVHRVHQWAFQDGRDESLMNVVDDCQHVVENLRQGLPSIPLDLQRLARSIRPVDPPSNTSQSLTAEQMAFVPAQSILTCYYSVNCQNAMNHCRVLDPARMAGIQSIPAVAVHGGLDRVCPVDTALDLLAAWPTLELRIPLASGHSQYDAAIQNQLVRATDSMAERLVLLGRDKL